MQLSVLERLLLGSLLPVDNATWLDLTTAIHIREDIGLSKEQVDSLKFQTETVGEPPNQKQNTVWDEQADKAIGLLKVEFTRQQKELVVGILEKLGKAEKGRVELLSLCEKFEVGVA